MAANWHFTVSTYIVAKSESGLSSRLQAEDWEDANVIGVSFTFLTMPWRLPTFRYKNWSAQTQIKRCKHLIFAYPISTFLQIAPLFLLKAKMAQFKIWVPCSFSPRQHDTSPNYSEFFFFSPFRKSR